MYYFVLLFIQSSDFTSGHVPWYSYGKKKTKNTLKWTPFMKFHRHKLLCIPLVESS